MKTAMQAPSRRAEQRSGARQRILETASHLIAERGYAGTTISAIVDESGLPPTSIYWHFDSKEGLLAAVLEAGAAGWFETMPRWDDLTGPVRERLAQFFDRIAESLALKPDFLRMLLLLALERKEIDATTLAAIRNIRSQAIDRVHASLEKVFESLGPEQASRVARECDRLALAFADGCFLAHHIDPGMTDPRRMFALLKTMFLAYSEHLVQNRGSEH